MKRAILLFVCVLGFSQIHAAPAKSATAKTALSKPSGDPRSALDALLDFSISLKEIDRAVKNGAEASIPSGRFFILNGTLGSVLIRSREGQEFLAEAELVNGQWQGLDTVEMYRAIVVFSGADFEPFFAKDSPARLKTGDVVMIVGSYTGTADDYTMREKVAVLRAEMIRYLE